MASASHSEVMRQLNARVGGGDKTLLLVTPPWFTLVKTPYWVPPALAFIMRALDMLLCIQGVGKNPRLWW